MKPGDQVIVHSDNPEVDGKPGTILEVQWVPVYHLSVPTRGGKYRAFEFEVTPLHPQRNGVHTPEPKRHGYTGSSCQKCGGVKMIRAGACEVCEECGDSSGCS